MKLSALASRTSPVAPAVTVGTSLGLCAVAIVAASLGCSRSSQGAASKPGAHTPSAHPALANDSFRQHAARPDPAAEASQRRSAGNVSPVALSASAGSTAIAAVRIVPHSSATLWVETRAAVRRGEGLSIIGGESVRVGRPPNMSPSPGPLVNLGQVSKGTPVDLTIEVDLSSTVVPGTY